MKSMKDLSVIGGAIAVVIFLVLAVRQVPQIWENFLAGQRSKAVNEFLGRIAPQNLPGAACFKNPGDAIVKFDADKGYTELPKDSPRAKKWQAATEVGHLTNKPLVFKLKDETSNYFNGTEGTVTIDLGILSCVLNSYTNR